MRALAPSATVDYAPLSLADVPRLLASGRLVLDVALIQVAPPDADFLFPAMFEGGPFEDLVAAVRDEVSRGLAGANG